MKEKDRINEKDEYIKSKLQIDKISDDKLFNDVNQKILNSKVKVSKFSYKKQVFLVIILILILLATILFLANTYFDFIDFSKLGKNQKVALVQNNVIENQLPTNKAINNVANATNNIIVNDASNIANNTINSISNTTNNTLTNNASNITNNTAVNNISNEITNNTVKNETNTVTNQILKPTNELPITITPDDSQNDFSNVNMEDLEKFVESFSIGIQRISLEDDNNLESNTILLYIAKHYFDTKTSTSLNISTEYASSLSNIHKFLTEFTGKDYTKVPKIASFNNYIGYKDSSNSYVSGKDISKISKEKYSVTDLKIEKVFAGNYTAVAKVTRNIGNDSTSYKLTFTFSINNDYKYSEFCLKSLEAVSSVYPDNTVHLVDISD